MENFFLEWPDTATKNLQLIRSKFAHPSHAIWAIRSGNFSHIEIQSYLLSIKAQTSIDIQDKLIALSCLYFSRFDFSAFVSTLNELRAIAPERLEVRALTVILWLWQDDISSIALAPSGIWAGIEDSLLLRICRSYYLLKNGQPNDALNLIVGEENPPLEVYLVKAKILSALGKYLEAVMHLKPICQRAKMNLRFHKQFLQHQMDARDGIDIKQNVAEALSLFGEHPQLLYHCTALNLFQRQPGLARRSALLEQVWASVSKTPIIVGNQVNAYEGNGSSDWTEYLLPSVTSLSIRTHAQLHSNLIMQLASAESSKYQDYSSRLVSAISSEKEFLCFKNAEPRLPDQPLPRDRLRIAWISGDLEYHPVSRFLLGFFASAKGSLFHSHEIVSTQLTGPTSMVDFFRQGCGVDVLQLSGPFDASRVSRIRSREYDIAIDLSGWTAGNFAAGFLSRLAPVQVNYLGYFASTGLPTMDYWIGDHALFPTPMNEWSTEKIIRLKRPFIAWKPIEPLPEAGVCVTESVSGPIRFGSFNHNRKLSDKTLRLWARVLENVAGSRLVLKASNATDSDTQRLLRRRMHRQGLDPARVDWLQLTKGPVEHLHQYSQMDIALDPIPNGGCTTTCEAMWMGVPTITLSGSNYVSRMSTAVLSAACMNDWIARDEDDYILLAAKQASRIKELRDNRQKWRDQLMKTPLGDPLDLMRHLEAAFSQMHTESITLK